MAKGKQTCKILKEIRKQIAAENDIDLVVSECTYQGDCLGTCPKCEAEVRYLERELEKRQRMGKAAIFAGMTIGTAITAAGCGPLAPTPNGMMENPRDTIVAADTFRNDSVEKPVLLEGDVLAPEPDSLEEDGEVTEGFVVPWTDDSDEPEVYQIVEQMPEFPGGQEAMEKYINDNVRFWEVIKEWQCDVSGKIFVGFIVEPDGSITNVKVLRGIEKHCDEEAMRVVKSMPKWKPGMLNGEPVRVSYMVPVAIPQLQ